MAASGTFRQGGLAPVGPVASAELRAKRAATVGSVLAEQARNGQIEDGGYRRQNR
jgi:hypothetical protein